MMNEPLAWWLNFSPAGGAHVPSKHKRGHRKGRRMVDVWSSLKKRARSLRLDGGFPVVVKEPELYLNASVFRSAA